MNNSEIVAEMRKPIGEFSAQMSEFSFLKPGDYITSKRWKGSKIKDIFSVDFSSDSLSVKAGERSKELKNFFERDPDLKSYGLLFNVTDGKLIIKWPPVTGERRVQAQKRVVGFFNQAIDKLREVRQKLKKSLLDNQSKEEKSRRTKTLDECFEKVKKEAKDLCLKHEKSCFSAR